MGYAERNHILHSINGYFCSMQCFSLQFFQVFRFRAILTIGFLIIGSRTFAEDTVRIIQKDRFKVTSYLEAYYSYDFGKPETKQRPSFFYNHTRHNELNMNLGFVKGSYSGKTTRANLALMAGTYATNNLAVEPEWARNIFEANFGTRMSKKHNLWFDAGVFPSHIGFESAVGKDCYTLTRSMVAENTPYYEAGLRFSYTSKNDKWYAALLSLNGWQRIKNPNINKSPFYGTQVIYKPTSELLLNHSSFIGNMASDSLPLWRYYHNFYVTYTRNKVSAVFGFDHGMQVKRDSLNKTSGHSFWFTPTIILKYQVNRKFSGALRLEYFKDEDGVVIATGTPNGFNTYGYSFNLDYILSPNFMLRTEARGLGSKDKIFYNGKSTESVNYFVTTCLIISM